MWEGKSSKEQEENPPKEQEGKSSEEQEENPPKNRRKILQRTGGFEKDEEK
jgi:hypothetical protein